MTTPEHEADPVPAGQFSLLDVLLPLVLIAGVVAGSFAGVRSLGWLGALLGGVGGLLVAFVGFILVMAVLALLIFLFGEDGIFLPPVAPGEPPPVLPPGFRRTRAIVRAVAAIGVLVAIGIAWIWRR